VRSAVGDPERVAVRGGERAAERAATHGATGADPDPRADARAHAAADARADPDTRAERGGPGRLGLRPRAIGR